MVSGGAVVERESLFSVAWEVGKSNPQTILHAVDGDGGSLCGSLTADGLALIEGARWSSDLAGHRCRPCQLVGEPGPSPIVQLAADARELHERLLRIAQALALCEEVLGDAYDRMAKADQAASARVTAEECRTFAERLNSL